MILTDFEVRLMAENARMALEIARLERYVTELRAGLDALLQPASSELLPKNSTHPSRQRCKADLTTVTPKTTKSLIT